MLPAALRASFAHGRCRLPLPQAAARPAPSAETAQRLIAIVAARHGDSDLIPCAAWAEPRLPELPHEHTVEAAWCRPHTVELLTRVTVSTLLDNLTTAVAHRPVREARWNVAPLAKARTLLFASDQVRTCNRIDTNPRYRLCIAACCWPSMS